tara:strand:- start:313 stop:438 length:126 start_codon:yes stop_codon:yes gene_type:complete
MLASCVTSPKVEVTIVVGFDAFAIYLYNLLILIQQLVSKEV